MVFLIAFLGGMLVLLLATAVPLKHVRLASNMLVLAGSVFRLPEWETLETRLSRTCIFRPRR